MATDSSAPPLLGWPAQALTRSAIFSFAELEEILLGLYDLAPRGVLLTRPEGTIAGANAAVATMLGYSVEELIGRHFNSITHPDDTQLGIEGIRAVMRGESPRVVTEKRYLCKDGHPLWAHVDGNPIRDKQGNLLLFLSFVEDISEKRQREELRRSAEEQQAKLQAQIIAAQRDAIHQLQTPIIPIREGVLAVPIIGAIDPERAHLLLGAVLSSVSTERASIVIVDITGVSSIDGEVANLLARMAQALKLLGAHVLLSGIRAEVAQKMVELGVDLSGIQTVGSFQRAIALAFMGQSDGDVRSTVAHNQQR